jgi:predicted Zn-dependent protease
VFQKAAEKHLELTDQDVSKVIAIYRSSDPQKSVLALRKSLSAPITSQAFRESILKHLPSERVRLRLNDPSLIAALHQVIKPVLDLYNRTDAYELIVIQHPMPLVMSDSGVVVLFTTGTLARASSDDELLGLAAHEIGHELLASRSVLFRNLYEQSLIASGSLSQPLVLRQELAKLELECDAIAALTLAALGKDPGEYSRSIERVAKEYPGISIGNHPAEKQRVRVITEVGGNRLPSCCQQNTAPFNGLKRLVQELHKAAN